METETVEILKWVGILLAAGLTGYFGRHLVMFIRRTRRKRFIERIRKRKTPQAYAREANKKILTRLNKRIAENQLRSEKELAKIKAKRVRKKKKKK